MIGGELGVSAGAGYLIALAVATVVAVVGGVWWFVTGEGERRLRVAPEAAFDPDRGGRPEA